MRRGLKAGRGEVRAEGLAGGGEGAPIEGCGEGLGSPSEVDALAGEAVGR